MGSNFTIRKDAFVYYRKQTEFKQYVEKLYCDLKIKDLFISKKYSADAVIDYYIDCKRGDINVGIIKMINQMELNTFHVFWSIYFIQNENDYVKIGKSNDISTYDVLDVIGLAKSLVMSFHEIISLKKAKTMEIVFNHIIKLKCSCVDD